MFVQHFEGTNTVNTVNGWEQIVWIIETHFVLQKFRQIKMVLGKHNPYWLDPPGYQLRLLHTFILNLHDLMPLNRIPDLLKAIKDAFVILWLYVMVFFVYDQFLYCFLVTANSVV